MSNFTNYTCKLRENVLKKCCNILPSKTLSNTAAFTKAETTMTVTTHEKLSSNNSDLSTDYTYSNTQQCRFFDRERINLESHQLVWCDSSVNNNFNLAESITLEELRKIVDYSKLFENVQDCLEHLERTTDTVTFLVCSRNAVEKLISHIHELKFIRIIYVYFRNSDEDNYKQWSSSFTKVKKIYTNINKLLEHLKEDVELYLKQEKDGIFTETHSKDTTSDALGFHGVGWPWLIDVLCHLPYPDNCHQMLVNSLKRYYEGKSNELEILREFACDYSAKNAVWWYTRETFLYRILNRALRQHNIEQVFLLGFFVKDLYLQLDEGYKKFQDMHSTNPLITVYRGQLVSYDEFDRLGTPYNTTITTNSFLSTSLRESVSVDFLHSSTAPEGIVKVQLIIELDLTKRSRPFSIISHRSALSKEDEVLFMPGTHLNIVEKWKSKTDENIFIILLRLRDNKNIEDDDTNLEGLTGRRLLKKCSNLLVDYFYQAPVEDINRCFNELISIFPYEKWLEAARYQCCGLHYERKGMIEDSQLIISNYEQSIDLWQQYIDDDVLNCAFEIADIHRSMGYAYQDRVYDIALAKEQYNLGIRCGKDAIERMKDDREIKVLLYKTLSLSHKKRMQISNNEEERKADSCAAIEYERLAEQETIKERGTVSSQNDLK